MGTLDNKALGLAPDGTAGSRRNAGAVACRRSIALGLILAGVAAGMSTGCSRLRPKRSEQYVYVTSKQGVLRDRVAAVSNRTGNVVNGDRLHLLEHGRKFVRVTTEKGETGWIEEKNVATQETFDEFEKQKDQHKQDPAVASAVVRDEVYMHLAPGRDTEKFFLLNEGEKLRLLSRATLVKTAPAGGGAKALVRQSTKAVGSTKAQVASGLPGAKKEGAVVPEPVAPVMEDWWLARDSQGHTGWVLSRMMDVDAPDTLVKYAEGQRIVAAYVLAVVHDDEAEQDEKNIPEYVTVLSPYKAGLPYDFDQVRVFTWNLKKHRYETGFREKNIEGYLPVTVKMEADPNGKGIQAQAPAPTFSYKVLTAAAPPVVPNATTGAVVPTETVTKKYRLEGSTLRRVLAPGEMPVDLARPVPEEEKKGRAKGRRAR